MMRFLLLVLMVPLIGFPSGEAAHPAFLEAVDSRAAVRVEMLDGLLLPDSPVHLRFTVTSTPETNLVVLIVNVTSRIDVEIEQGEGSCEQPYNERTRKYDVMMCVFDQPASEVVVNATLQPRRITVSAFDCKTPLHLGVPVWVAVNGLEIIPETSKVWAPYQAGFCNYLPGVSR